MSDQTGGGLFLLVSMALILLVVSSDIVGLLLLFVSVTCGVLILCDGVIAFCFVMHDCWWSAVP